MRPTYTTALKSFAENGHVQEKLEPDYLIHELTKCGVITSTEADGIVAKSSRLARQQELFLNLIPQRGDEAFEKLLNVMDVEHYHWAREMLQRMVDKADTRKGN